jgi:pimeloyl-ACP methyl ester carboxylesterase
VRVEEHTTTIDDVPVFYRTAGEVGPGSGVPLYLHEALTSSDDVITFLERTGGLAPDLIGFGRSGKGGHLDYSPEGLVSFLARLLDELGLARVSPVGHGWGGALALLLALREPARVQRTVLIDAVPLLDGFRWHRPARLWRRRMVGELVMGSVTRRQLARFLRKGGQAWSDERLSAIWEQFDQGTQRALLRLHRAADEQTLAQLGTPLPSLTAPALVIWGERDPWFAPEFAGAYGAALPNARVEGVGDAGHWPWIDQPKVIDLVADFLAAT